MLSAAIIADDLTGAADCAGAFAAAGLRAFVALGDGCAAEAPVLAWDTDSRAAAPAAAAARVHAVAMRALDLGARVLYKKLDSTLRGPVGAEVAALFRAAAARTPGRTVVIAAPAFPGQGRTLVGGRVHIDGVPIQEARSARTPGGGGGDCDLVAMLSAEGLRTALATKAALRDGFLDGSAEAIVCDAEDDEGLRRIAALGAALPGRVVWAGSGGLARHLPQALALRGGGEGLAPFEAGPGPLLLLIGSRSVAAREQVRVLCAEPGVDSFELDPAGLLSGAGSADAATVAARAGRAIAAGRDVALVLGRDLLIDAGAGPALAAALARLAAPLAARAGGLVATGGEIARAALLELGATGIHLAGEVEPGVPFGFLAAPRRLPIATKAGAFGGPSTLSRCRAALKGEKS